MDEIDLAIIEILTEDARTSFRSIARDLGVSPDTVINRYQNLQEEGFIRGSTVVVDPKKIEYQGMAVFLIDVSPMHIIATEATTDSMRILDTLIHMKNIIVAAKTVGDHDIFALGVVLDFEHLIRIGNEIAEIPGVEDLQVSFWTEKMEVCHKYFIV